jgi:hypothetical protein
LVKADALLAGAEAEQTRSLDRLAENTADTYDRLGAIALTRPLLLAAALCITANLAANVSVGSRAARGGSHPWLSLSALRYLRLTYAGRYIARQKDEI